MENWDGASDIGEEEILNSSFSSIVNIEAEDLAPVNLPTHPVARAAQMLGEEHFATSWI